MQHWSQSYFGPHGYLFDGVSHLGVHRPPHIFEVAEWHVLVSWRISLVLEQSRVSLTSEQILENSYPTKTERGFGFNRDKLEKARARLISLQAVYSGFSQENKYKQARARLIRLHAVYRGFSQRLTYTQTRARLIRLTDCSITSKGEIVATSSASPLLAYTGEGLLIKVIAHTSYSPVTSMKKSRNTTSDLEQSATPKSATGLCLMCEGLPTPCAIYIYIDIYIYIHTHIYRCIYICLYILYIYRSFPPPCCARG